MCTYRYKIKSKFKSKDGSCKDPYIATNTPICGDSAICMQHCCYSPRSPNFPAMMKLLCCTNYWREKYQAKANLKRANWQYRPWSESGYRG